MPTPSLLELHAQHSACAMPPESELPGHLAQVVAVWRGMCPPDGGLPDWACFDPVAVPDALGMISLLEVRHPGPSFFCRLYGTKLYAALGQDLTGKPMAEAVPNFTGSAAEADYRYVVRSGQPRLYSGPPSLWSPKRIERVNVAMLPFAADGVRVDRIMLVVHLPGR